MTTVDLIGSPKTYSQRGYRKSTRYSFHLHFMFFKILFTFPNAFLDKKTNQKGFKHNRNFQQREFIACRMNSKAKEVIPF